MYVYDHYQALLILRCSYQILFRLSELLIPNHHWNHHHYRIIIFEYIIILIITSNHHYNRIMLDVLIHSKVDLPVKYLWFCLRWRRSTVVWSSWRGSWTSRRRNVRVWRGSNARPSEISTSRLNKTTFCRKSWTNSEISSVWAEVTNLRESLLSSGLIIRYFDDWVSACRGLVVEGTRGRGRSRKTWDQCVRDDMKLLGLHPEWAVFRDMWRDLIWGKRLTLA